MATNTNTNNNNNNTMRIAVTAIDAVGHLNPLVALCSGLLDKGHDIRFFLTSPINLENLEKVAKLHPNGSVSFQKYYDEPFDLQEVMAQRNELLSDPDEYEEVTNDMFIFGLHKEVERVETYIEDVKEYSPNLIIADPVYATPFIAASLLQIPCVSTLTLPGFGCLPQFFGYNTEEERRKNLKMIKRGAIVTKARERLYSLYGFDYFDNFLPLSNMLPTGLNLCTSIAEFDSGIPAELMEAYSGDLTPSMSFVGPMVLTEAEGRVSGGTSGLSGAKPLGDDDAPFPHDQLAEWKREGRKIVYAAFGTVTTGFMYDPVINGSFEAKCFGARSTGKDFVMSLWPRIFRAFADNDKYAVVAATGPKETIEGLEIPSNFIVRQRCPQIACLEQADVFITHGGFNSTMESICAKVPMLVMPYFADQFDNGRLVTRERIGKHYENPVESADWQTISNDIDSLLMLGDSLGENMDRLQKSIESAGGTEAAVNAVEKYVANFKGHSKLKTKPELLQRCSTGSFRGLEPEVFTNLEI